ncbi:hypothetical protein AAHE18_08G136400 [Arachis hypogaea]
MQSKNYIKAKSKEAPHFEFAPSTLKELIASISRKRRIPPSLTLPCPLPANQSLSYSHHSFILQFPHLTLYSSYFSLVLILQPHGKKLHNIYDSYMYSSLF